MALGQCKVRFNMIVAADEKLGIGKNLLLPWNLPTDRTFYLNCVNKVSPNKKNAMIVGRLTESISKQERKPHKLFFVLSKTLKELPPKADYLCRSLEEALSIIEGPELRDVVENVWIIGGYGAYKAGLESPQCHRYYITRVYGDFQCDAFCPDVDLTKFKLVSDPHIHTEEQEENGIKFKFEIKMQNIQQMAVQKNYNLIVAACRCKDSLGIGINGTIPWRLRTDLKFFSAQTSKTTESDKKNAVIMGRKTWLSIPGKFRPLPNRVNVVLSKTLSECPADADHLCHSLDQAINLLSEPPIANGIDAIWIIGGSSVYKEAMESSLCHRIYLTRIHAEFECDTFISEIDTSKFQQVHDPEVNSERQKENNIEFNFEIYQNVQHTSTL
ncbi:putative bifunctional dihydrofolate reductase-thymidylate synthase [Acanthaster planci]|uniref:dihydrofolate reductase n=1 Tax=Acanthaster planci TaxID=133434 RepID=A0A8B7ZNQ9_ACAPL|nr:putative bifunctional dihydrofolate reductase-thymidylate synthase [Acanthaster planci]